MIPHQIDQLNGPIYARKILRHSSEKLTAKFSATTCSYSLVKIACLNDAFSEMFVLDASPVHVEG